MAAKTHFKFWYGFGNHSLDRYDVEIGHQDAPSCNPTMASTDYPRRIQARHVGNRNTNIRIINAPKHGFPAPQSQEDHACERSP